MNKIYISAHKPKKKEKTQSKSQESAKYKFSVRGKISGEAGSRFCPQSQTAVSAFLCTKRSKFRTGGRGLDFIATKIPPMSAIK